jgi:outer membrane biogenesis lipoprotein LolB
MMIVSAQPYRWLLLLAWSLLGTLSCAVFRPAREYPPYPFAAQLSADLHARAAYWQTFQAQASIRIQSVGGNYRLQAFLTSSPPDRLRFEATNPAGQTIWALIINPETAMLWVPTEGVCYHARSGETILRHFAGTPIPPVVFAYSFVGVIPPQYLDAADFRLVAKSDVVLCQYQDPSRQWRFAWELTPRPPALQSLRAEAGDGLDADESTTLHRYSIRFEPPVTIHPETYPRKVFISTPKWQLEGVLKQVVKLETVPLHAFDAVTVSGIKNVNLDEP